MQDLKPNFKINLLHLGLILTVYVQILILIFKKNQKIFH